MRNATMLRLLGALVLAGAMSSAWAGNKPVQVENVKKFLDHQAQLREDLDGRKFAHMDLESKRRIRAAQDVLFEVLNGRADTDGLDEAQRVLVLNAESEIAAVLTDSELDKPVCERKERLGSKRPQIECLSKRQREADRLAAHGLRFTPRNCDDAALCVQDGGANPLVSGKQ